RSAPPRPATGPEPPAARVVDTPETPTIESLVALLNGRPDLARYDARPWRAADTLKNVLVTLTFPDGHRQPLAVGVPGDRDVDVRRLEAQLAPAEVTPFDDDAFAAHPELVKGYIGPGVLGSRRGVRYLVDPRVVSGSAWVTGADAAGHHVVD